MILVADGSRWHRESDSTKTNAFEISISPRSYWLCSAFCVVALACARLLIYAMPFLNDQIEGVLWGYTMLAIGAGCLFVILFVPSNLAELRVIPFLLICGLSATSFWTINDRSDLLVKSRWCAHGEVIEKYRSPNHALLSIRVRDANSEKVISLEGLPDHTWNNVRIGSEYFKDAGCTTAVIDGKVFQAFVIHSESPYQLRSLSRFRED